MKARHWVWGAAVLVLAVSVDVARATPIPFGSILASEDVNVSPLLAAADDSNFIYIQNNSATTANPREGFLRFTLPASGDYQPGTITNAQVLLSVQQNTLGAATASAAGTVTLWSTQGVLRTTTTPWSESNITWASRPEEIASLATFTGTSGTFTFSGAALDTYLNTLAPGDSASFRVTIDFMDTTEADYIRFSSRERSTSAGPRLQFEASVPEPQTAWLLAAAGLALMLPRRSRTH
jgi:hypothetical protein